jgi:hypothetical protein
MKARDASEIGRAQFLSTSRASDGGLAARPRIVAAAALWRASIVESGRSAVQSAHPFIDMASETTSKPYRRRQNQ